MKVLKLVGLSALVLSLVACGTKDKEVVATPVLSENYKTISTEEMKEVLKKDNTVVVDTRINDAFNGWALDGMKTGGHIEKATDFSANWLRTDVEKAKKEKALEEALATKGITSDKEVVLYDSNGEDALEVAKYLESMGITNISIYDVKQWDAENQPLKAFSSYELIVPATWVNENLDKGYKVFEVSWGPEETATDYKNGHIPGAVHIDTDEIESAPLWSINKDEDLLNFAKNNGITKDDKIILYSTNPMPSYRLAAILTYLGVSDVRVLNGGLPAWKSAGFALETKSNPKVPGTGFGADKPLNKNLIVGIDEAKNVANSSNGHLVDIRSWEEHIGQITGYSDLDYKGRPKNSIWGKAGSNPNELEEYRNIDSTMRNGNEIIAMWNELGINEKNQISFFCGSGWRAAEVLIFAHVLGAKNSSLYSNGWYEWSSNPENEVEMGEPKKK